MVSKLYARQKSHSKHDGKESIQTIAVGEQDVLKGWTCLCLKVSLSEKKKKVPFQFFKVRRSFIVFVDVLDDRSI